MYKVNFYISPNKSSPIEKFLDSCQSALKVKILRQFKYIEEYGLTRVIPNIKKIVKTPFWELRILGRDNIRIICVASSAKEIKILHIFRKKKQKTPAREINTALKRYYLLDK